MRNISPQNQAALEGRQLIARDFIWFKVRRRDDNSQVQEGYWSDVGTYAAEVVDPNTGLIVTRLWSGSGTLIEIDDIPLVSNLTVQTITVRLNQIDDRIERLIREYDCKQGTVEIFRGLFDINTRRLVAPAESRFTGFIDVIDIETPSEGEVGKVDLRCVSHTQEVTRSNPETRSDAAQRVRQANDDFYKDAATVPEWEIFWGSTKGVVPTQKRKKFLGIF